MVNFIDNLQVSGQNHLQHRHLPPFKGFRKNSMVGVGTSAISNIPCLIPTNTRACLKLEIIMKIKEK